MSILRCLIPLISLSLALLPSVGAAFAGGLLGDAINIIAPGAGTALDDAHRQLKDAVPPYKAIEEGASRAVNETFVQAGAPALQELIARSRDDALRIGVQPIPDEIRQNLSGFIPDAIMNVARYRVQGGGDLTLQVNAIRYGEASAIVLDYVIVFKFENDALYNLSLWVHELTHVAQYQRWGIRDFAIRYLRSHGEVENEAYQAETRYGAWTAVRNQGQFSSGSPPNPAVFNRPVVPFGAAGMSSQCSSNAGICHVNGSAPVGTSCWCNTVVGQAMGSLVPDMNQIPSPTQSGLPSGFGMRVCGCWGPNPMPTAFEPRCTSNQVRVNLCPGFCAPGHPLYAYVCM